MKIALQDLIDICISLFKFNKKKVYKEFVILSSISQLIRGKSHNEKNLNNLLKRLAKYVFLFLRILRFNFNILFKNRKQIVSKYDYDLLIIYPNNDKWILRGLSKDIEKEIKNLNFRVKSCELKNIFKYNPKHIFFSHHKIALKFINKYPYYTNFSSTYISHIRTIGLKEVELLNRLKYIFCQSSKDKMRLNSFGFLPGRIKHLPIGYNKKLFFSHKEFRNREYDFVISTPLKINSVGNHYWLRKSPVLLIETLSILAFKGYKILIIGDNWEKSFLENHNNITIRKINYLDKSSLLNNCKFFLNLSLIEGGPVTILEAIASGCKVITKDNGNSYDITLDIPDICFGIKNILSAEEISSKIINIFDDNQNTIKKESLKNLEKFYSYEVLGKKIIETIIK